MKNSAHIDHHRRLPGSQGRNHHQPAVESRLNELVPADGPIKASLETLLNHPDVERVTLTQVDIRLRKDQAEAEYDQRHLWE